MSFNNRNSIIKKCRSMLTCW